MLKKYHTMTTVLVNLIMMFMVLLTNNMIILTAIFIWNLTIAYVYKGFLKYKKIMPYFLSLSLMTLIINSLFVEAGTVEIFKIFGKVVTLEVMVYGIIMSYKILIVIVLFISLELMMDSDKAVSYFSQKMPKTSLMMLIGIKLIPNMENRLNNLKDIYTIRGLNYEEKGMKNRINNAVPILSILLEDSLEGSFDIAEASYVKRALRKNRGVYKKEKYYPRDILICTLAIISFIGYLIFSKYYKINFDIYSDFKDLRMISIQSIILALLILSISLISFVHIKDSTL
ncbi:energy-coupling factor transporter transmembrane component T [Clostridium amazonitimonense]|uniref:energy-coupling factor transporter transmembrane component T n=1 Tax=Clostridium amazonitimonense TaxID=1499689 RepID=UPI0005094187|nr:energy-coupling factor transporter transmembrane component T [Clostridium amazonitimonense]